MEWINSTHVGNVNILPNISISTITTTLKLNCKFNLLNIYKYVKLDSNNIIGFKRNGWVRIKLGNNIIFLPPAPHDSDSDDDDDKEDKIDENINIEDEPKKKKKLPSHYNEIKSFYPDLKIKRSKNRFFNQVTAYIKIDTDRYINVKIFKNGSLQMTGIKKISECNTIINKLLDVTKTAVNSNTIPVLPNNILLPEFIKTPLAPNTMIEFFEKADEELKVTDFNIRMINSNCKVPFKINRDALFQILKQEKIKCRYDPNSHACVNIRHDINSTDKVSIFVFQSGSIIITGGKTIADINKGYNYIMTIISKHYEQIKKKDLDEYINSLDTNDDENKNLINLSKT